MDAEKKKKLIVVTGFGPFTGHEDVNASWEAVKLLPETVYGKFYLKKYEVPVTYSNVDEIVEEIWKQKPYLVIHVGVHGRASAICVEKLAYNHQFNKLDFECKKLDCPTVRLENHNQKCTKIFTKFNISRIVTLVNKLKGCMCDQNTPQFCCISSDVGNYLCGYIYLKSLDRNPERSLFLHVPPVNQPLSSQDTSDGILEIVKECVRQLEEKELTSGKFYKIFFIIISIPLIAGIALWWNR